MTSVYELAGASRRRTITEERTPGIAVADALWGCYYEAFEPLQELALLNHLYHRDEFSALVEDRRVMKLVARVDGLPVGMGMVTNELDIVPQISPPFLNRRYPDLAARQAIYFAILVFVADGHRRGSLFARLVSGMAQIAALDDGLIVFDVCRHNMQELSLHEQLRRVAGWFPQSSFEAIDSQAYFAARFPMPLQGRETATPNEIDPARLRQPALA